MQRKPTEAGVVPEKMKSLEGELQAFGYFVTQFRSPSRKSSARLNIDTTPWGVLP